MTSIDHPQWAADVLSCPNCATGSLDSRTADVRGMTRCGTCGARAYAGYVAEAATLLGYRSQVQRRLDWLTEQVRTGAPGPVAAARSRGPAAAQQAPVAPAAVAAPIEGATILLGLGTALLVIAAIVFVAVVWTRIGALGQATVLTSLVIGLGTVAVRLRERLPATAEALAVSSLGIMAIELLAAPHLGLVRIDEPGWGGWWPAFSWAVVALAGLGAGRAYALRAWTALGWLSTIPATGFLALAVTRHADWAEPGRASGLGAALAIVVGLGLLGVPGKQPWATASGSVILGGAVALTPMAVVVDGARPGWLVAGAVALTGLVVQRSRLAVGPLSRTGWELAFAITAGASTALALLPPDATQLGWAVAAALLGAAGFGGGVRLGRVLPGYAAAVSLWLSWIGGRALQEAPLSTGTLAVQVVLVLGTAAAVLLTDAQLGRRPELAWAGAAVGIVATWIGMAQVPAVAVEAYSLPAAGLLLVAGLVWRGQRHGSSMVWCGPATGAALIPSALATWTGWTSPESTEHLLRLGAVLAAAAALTLLGARLKWSGVALPAGAAFSVAAMAGITETAQRVGVLEVFTLPTAALLLAGGLLLRRYVPCGSLVWCGPAVAMALIPSAVLTWTVPWTALDFGDQPTESLGELLRLVAVLVVGAAFAVAGSRFKWAGLLFPAATAVAIAATGQVLATAHLLPKWMVLAAVGAALVTAGARLEWLRDQRVRVEDWAARLA